MFGGKIIGGHGVAKNKNQRGTIAGILALLTLHFLLSDRQIKLNAVECV